MPCIYEVSVHKHVKAAVKATKLKMGRKLYHPISLYSPWISRTFLRFTGQK